MASNRNAVEDHENGIRYGGKILSLIPAPEGWFVGTRVSQYNRKTNEIAHDTPQAFPLIGWALVDAMFRGGSRETRVEPLFLGDSGSVTHATEFRWRHGAGDVDEDGWRTSVAVDVIPAPGAVADIPAYGVAEIHSPVMTEPSRAAVNERWFHRGPCCGPCPNCGADEGCLVYNDDIHPEIHTCAKGCQCPPECTVHHPENP